MDIIRNWSIFNEEPSIKLLIFKTN